MHMEVRDALADAVVDGDERAVSFEAQFDRSGQRLDVRDRAVAVSSGKATA